MKIKIFSLVVMIAFVACCMAMERPLPHDHIRTTKEVTLKLAIDRKVHDVIQGCDREESLPVLDPDHPLMDASPVSFFKGLRDIHQARLHQKLDQKGISRELVHAMYAEAEKYMVEEKAKIRQFPADSSLKKEVSSVAQQMGVASPEVHIAELDNPAECHGDSLLVDPSYLYADAPTPGRRAVIYAHELRHRANKEYREYVATQMACDLKAVDLSPDHSKKQCRLNEVFADLESVALHKEWAENFKRLSEQNLEAYGPGSVCTHPSRAHRKRLSELTVDLHETHEQYKIPRKQHTRVENKENKRLPVNRNLINEFESSE